MSSSWKLESSQTIHASSGIAPSSAVSGRPTLPATATGRPAARNIVAEELARRRLPVRAGDADQRVREQPRAELDLAPDGDAARARGGHEGRLARNAGALDQQVHVVDERGVFRAEDDFDACLAKPPGVELVVSVDADDAHAPACERERRGLARAREAEHEGPTQEANSDA